ncbi:MAG: alternative ribosome rescue aminoacyl-tRNA hydrolase ArfB [Microthrixaceae bacterium]
MSTDDIHVLSGLVIPASEIIESFSASGGPGGQHANKVSTRVVLRFNAAESAALSESQRERIVARLGPQITVVVDEHRSQMRNRILARERLASRIRGAFVVRRTRRPTTATRGSQIRRLDAKRRRGETKSARRKPSVDD